MGLCQPTTVEAESSWVEGGRVGTLLPELGEEGRHRKAGREKNSYTQLLVRDKELAYVC